MSAKTIANRDAKAKRLLLILVPAIVVVGALQGPKLLATLGGGGAPAPTEALAPAPVDSDVPAGTPVPAATALRDSTRRPAVDVGELGRLDRFAPTDPFVQQVSGTVGGSAAEETPEAELPAEPAAPAIPAPAAPAAEAPAPPAAAPADPAEPVAAVAAVVPTGAVITVNGSPVEVASGEAFPPADPVFRLAEVDAGGGEIGLVDGRFSTGAGTISIAVGETRTLVSQPDGTRFRVRLVRVID